MEELTGGNSNHVIQDGNTVLRRMGPWSPFVQQLLEYLTASGFNESPVFLGTSGKQERLSFVPGDVGNFPLDPTMQTDTVLIEGARLLRRFHDLTQHFVVPRDAVFQLPPAAGEPHEVICHNDFAPYNCVFENGHLVGIIDFDTAGPGSRLWDMAYAVYRFAPLATDAHCASGGWQPMPDRAARVKLFCDAYGLDDRTRLIPTVRRRLQALIEHMTLTRSNLEHIPIYERDLAWIEAHEPALAAALVS